MCNSIHLTHNASCMKYIHLVGYQSRLYYVVYISVIHIVLYTFFIKRKLAIGTILA